MEKEELLRELIEEGLLRDPRVRAAFEKVDRKDFVPREHEKFAYANYPLNIGEGQTISQPYTVMFMTEALDVKEGMKVLEVGTGSGYQAAILAELAGTKGLVVTTEARKKLLDSAKSRLGKYKNIMIVFSSHGFEKESPYDRIIVTATATKIPVHLLKQLKEGGIMIIPIANEMYRIEKIKGKIKKEFLGHFSFVPLVE